MVTMAQRIEQLRMEKNMSRPALSQALGFSKNAAEKFETGRATPTKEQQEKLATYFGVSVAFLKGETDDRTSMNDWMSGNFGVDDEPDVPVIQTVTKKVTRAVSNQRDTEGGGMFEAFRNSKPFQEMIRNTVLDVLRSPEGEEILSRIVRKELNRR